MKCRSWFIPVVDVAAVDQIFVDVSCVKKSKYFLPKKYFFENVSIKPNFLTENYKRFTRCTKRNDLELYI